jgi:hypothetical protein
MEKNMKAYKGTFKKQNGQIREMLFAHLRDLPDTFLEERIIGSGTEKRYPAGMELVFDLEEEGFRIFNWSTQIGTVHQVKVDDSIIKQ